MTDEERFSLLYSLIPGIRSRSGSVVAPDVPPSAGYVAGIARLGIPALRLTDATGRGGIRYTGRTRAFVA